MNPVTHRGRTGEGLSVACVKRWLFLLAVVTGLGGLTVPALAQSTGNKLGITLQTSRDGEAVGAIEIVIPPGGTQGSKQLFLSQGGDKPIKDVRLIAAIDHADVKFTPAGGAENDPFTIPAAGEPVPVTASATKSDEGTVAGELLVKDGLARIAGVSVTRTTQAAIDILGADPATGLSLATKTADFRHTAQIASDSPNQTSVRVEVTPFTDPYGVQVTPSLELNGEPTTAVATVEVPARSSVPLTITFATPTAGDYTGSIRLVYEEQSRVVPVKVNRTDVAATLAFDDVATQRVENSWGEASTLYEVTVRETDGRTAVASQLTALHVVEVLNDTSKFGTGASAEIKIDSSGITEPIRFTPGQTRPFDVDIESLPGPGKYEVKLRLISGDASPIEMSTTILVRRSLEFALSVIFLAVALGALLRWYFTYHRGRLLSQEQIGQLANRMAAVRIRADELVPVEERVFDAMRRHLDDFYLATRQQTPADVSTSLDLLRLKLSEVLWRWIDARRRATKAGADELLEKLAGVEAFLKRPAPSSGSTVADAKNAATKTLDEVEDTLNKDYGLAKRIKEFRAAVDAYSAQEGSGDGLDEVETLLDQAQSGSADAEAKYSEAVAKWAGVCTADFLESIPPANDPPLGLSDAKWRTKHRQLTEKAEAARTARRPEQTLGICNQGSLMLVRALMEGLQARAKERGEAIGKQGGTANSELAGKLDALAQELGTSIQALSEDDVAIGRTAYESGFAEYKKLMTDAGQQLGSGRFVDAATVGRTAGIPQADPGQQVAVAEAKLPSPQSIGIKFFLYEVGTSLVVFIAAAFVGAEALYFPDSTWGDTRDIALALLWGLGLHAVGNKTFQGTLAIKQTFGPSES